MFQRPISSRSVFIAVLNDFKVDLDVTVAGKACHSVAATLTNANSPPSL